MIIINKIKRKSNFGRDLIKEDRRNNLAREQKDKKMRLKKELILIERKMLML